MSESDEGRDGSRVRKETGAMAPPNDPRQQMFANKIMQSLFPIDQAPVRRSGR